MTSSKIESQTLGQASTPVRASPGRSAIDSRQMPHGPRASCSGWLRPLTAAWCSCQTSINLRRVHHGIASTSLRVASSTPFLCNALIKSPMSVMNFSSLMFNPVWGRPCPCRHLPRLHRYRRNSRALGSGIHEAYAMCAGQGRPGADWGAGLRSAPVRSRPSITSVPVTACSSSRKNCAVSSCGTASKARAVPDGEGQVSGRSCSLLRVHTSREFVGMAANCQAGVPE